MDFLFVKSPKEKKKLNFYLNDNNLYVKNSLKMRKKHRSYINNTIKEQKELRKKYPVPKILYSTSELKFDKYKKSLLENYSPKNAINDLMCIVNNFTENFNFDDDKENEDQSDKQKISLDDDKIIKEIEKDNINNNSKDFPKKKKEKNVKEFFLTNKNIYNRDKNKMRNNTEYELLKDLEFAKSKNINDVYISSKDLQQLNNLKRNFKKNLYFENYGKFGFTKSGLIHPKKLGKYELPKYTGNNEEEKKYFNYRKKIFKPQLTYNKISDFSEKFNKDLGKINNNYGNIMSRTRFTKNPLMEKYMKVIPFYDVYKDLKQIENRYIGSNYKFRLLPLYNKRLTNIDRLADKFYKTQNFKEGLVNLINIQNANNNK